MYIDALHPIYHSHIIRVEPKDLRGAYTIACSLLSCVIEDFTGIKCVSSIMTRTDVTYSCMLHNVMLSSIKFIHRSQSIQVSFCPMLIQVLESFWYIFFFPSFCSRVE
jgi:hypothetical protein